MGAGILQLDAPQLGMRRTQQIGIVFGTLVFGMGVGGPRHINGTSTPVGRVLPRCP